MDQGVLGGIVRNFPGFHLEEADKLVAAEIILFKAGGEPVRDRGVELIDPGLIACQIHDSHGFSGEIETRLGGGPHLRPYDERLGGARRYRQQY